MGRADACHHQSSGQIGELDGLFQSLGGLHRPRTPNILLPQAARTDLAGTSMVAGHRGATIGAALMRATDPSGATVALLRDPHRRDGEGPSGPDRRPRCILPRPNSVSTVAARSRSTSEGTASTTSFSGCLPSPGWKTTSQSSAVAGCHHEDPPSDGGSSWWYICERLANKRCRRILRCALRRSLRQRQNLASTSHRRQAPFSLVRGFPAWDQR